MALRRTDSGALDFDQLETLDVRTWIAWLNGRVSTSDTLTGDVLIGSGNPVAIFRDVLPRLSAAAQNRFGQALLAAIQDASDASDDAHELLHHTRLLIAASDLLAALPTTVIKELGDIHGALEVLYGIVVGLDESSTPAVLRERLRGAAFRAIAARNPEVLSDEELVTLLAHVSTASGALRLLREREPELSVHWLAQFVAASLATDNADLIEPEIRRAGQDGDAAEEKQRQLLLEIIPLLDADYRAGFMVLPVVKGLMGSPTVDRLRRDRTFTASWKGLRADGVPPAWIEAVFEAIRERAASVTGVNLVLRPASDVVTWYDQATGAKSRTFAKDPIIGDPARTAVVDIVPYAYVREFLAVVATDGTRGGLAAQAATWTTVEDAVKSGTDIVVMTRTAATDEFADYLRDQNLRYDPALETEEFLALVNKLATNHTKTVLLVDTYFWDALKEIEEARQSFELGRHNLQLNAYKLRYRQPAIVGIPVARGDFVWGRIVRDVVDEVLYGDCHLLEDRTVQQNLRSMGFEPLTPEAYESESFWVPPVPELVPRAVADPVAFQRVLDTMARTKATAATRNGK